MADTKKTCFVVMGFGIKTDLATGRNLNLDKSYRLLIKPVVENKGLNCVRADEIRHSGTIDVPMYQQLLQADVVVADLSTANANAFYELGVRHALRPHTTIVISEDKLPYPFDLNHILITKYTHLGDAIDYDEVIRFQKVLGDTLEAVLKEEKPDSPVYTFLELVPPSLKEQVERAAEQMENVLKQAKEESERSGEAAAAQDASESNPTLAALVEQGEKAIRDKQYDLAKALFNSAMMLGNVHPDKHISSNAHYLIHRLAMATYKSGQPDEVSAAKEAMALLCKLNLEDTNYPESVSLAGAIEKRLFEAGQGDDHLNAAIKYYHRGFYLLNNRYNGINLAFLLNCRADSSIYNTQEDRIADLVFASRIRREVLELCEKDWNDIIKREGSVANKDNMLGAMDESMYEQNREKVQKFWVLVNKAEAHFGLGEMDAYEKARTEAGTIEHQPWMMEAFTHQVGELRKLLIKQGHLMNPPWKEQ